MSLAKALAGDPFAYTSDKPYEHDVQAASPPSRKPRTCSATVKTTLDEMLDEVIPWIREQLDHEGI